MAQKPQLRSQPSAIFTYAHGTLARGRGRLRRSSVGTVARLAAEGHRHTEAAHRVDLGERVGQLPAVPLGHAAGNDELGAGTASLVEGEDRVDGLPPRRPR